VTHREFSRVFQPGKLTFGFIAPLEGYPESAGPSLEGHVELARKADRMGMAAMWLRDVPFYESNFGDVGQILDPMVYAGWLAAVTRDIAIGTAGTRRTTCSGRKTSQTPTCCIESAAFLSQIALNKQKPRTVQ
jgi:hypothetical protein